MESRFYLAHGFGRDAQIVDYDSDGPPRGVALNRFRRRWRGDAFGGCRILQRRSVRTRDLWTRRAVRNVRNVCEARDGLLAAVFVNLEVVGSQTGYGFTVLRHHRINLYEVGRDFYHVVLIVSRLLLPHRGQKSADRQ